MHIETENQRTARIDRTSRIEHVEPLATPSDLKRRVGLSAAAAAFVARSRGEIEAVLRGEDPRMLAIVGPCSIHDPGAALEYAQRLAKLRGELSDELVICMRAYFEKPRTRVGWKGLINDPRLDGSCDVGAGLQLARELLVEFAGLGVPAATEMLDPMTPRYLADGVCWTAIGARTAESQTHREMASGLEMPVGFKNGTDGSLEIAIHAMHAARSGHSFIGVDELGRPGVVRTRGNPHSHLVLRGGRSRPNYHCADVEAARTALASGGLAARVLVDCSHDNSAQDPRNQPRVLEAIAQQLEAGSRALFGVMLESHLTEGRQDVRADRPLAYGQSITDACLGFDTTAQLLERLARANAAARTASRLASGGAFV
jgi:3-deoxy-7-phosphoheptulonate synthase